jgi:hypothetical protein
MRDLRHLSPCNNQQLLMWLCRNLLQAPHAAFSLPRQERCPILPHILPLLLRALVLLVFLLRRPLQPPLLRLFHPVRSECCVPVRGWHRRSQSEPCFGRLVRSCLTI